MKRFNTFMACCDDEFALPFVVCNSARELASWLGCDVAFLYFCLSENCRCCGYLVWAGVVL